ncbi:hypothetical protein BXZ70DRAFT_924895 [Cristinia sonorae]|uniref:Rho-GAP domain-containing protein n=1 Tax=Cristinia sonorae TaxID=1940300 RepID=A0A8K0XS06_9AGAR|nr:hypothetical protein BXZ70DRAFT_924895 [Cristinia sonorae]
MAFLKRTFAKRDPSTSSKNKPGHSTSPLALPKGILRRSTAISEVHQKTNTTDNDYPGIRARHSNILASYIPPGWHPGLDEPVIKGEINYISVNNVPTPNRYHRAHSTVPFPHPQPKSAARTLQLSLKKSHKRFTDFLDFKEIMSGELWHFKEQDGVADCERKKGTKFMILQAERDRFKQQQDYHVFGGHIKVIHDKASTPVSVHGYQFRVPIVLAACVEEIYRRGMKTPNLFSTKVDRRRILELIAEYDQLTDKAPLPDLRHESIHIVANLLRFWLKAVPVPLMHRTIFDGFYAWCVEPSLARETEFKYKIHTRQRRGDDGEYHSETDTEAEAEEAEDEACPGLPSFNSRKKRLRRKQRAIEREKRRIFAAEHPELVVNNRPSHQQRKAQVYRELVHLEKPQVNQARLMSLLIAPDCFAVMNYLFTFFASLLDYPDNKLTAKYLADQFAWKLLGGPNKYVSIELLEWLLTRWEHIAHAFKSEEALDWEKRREQKKSNQPRPSTSSARTTADDPSPQYQSPRRGSGASDAPSYHSTWSGPRSQSTSPGSPSSRRTSAYTTPPTSRSSSPRSATVPKPNPAPEADVPAVSPRLHDFNPGEPLCGPQPTPAAVEMTNPFESEINEEEDTPVISPFDWDVEYEAEDEDEEDVADVEDEPEQPERIAFQAIASLLHPRAALERAPSVQSEVASIYSQG